ncbi:tyrosine--tRNA ligase [Marinigracilibium pacificum]|uniref:Tyrosine--tRNA ligase n=1 Tax=Marinigracilibium pacificum TaxID=2729599 RepID=A0A848J7F3_9BACT|nr:tyrosine--tRNA ligase [Marinigracilibium pacificum]NMM50420.1 tyrosine--tRNA ligase [Marinigracilibium pacificum]
MKPDFIEELRWRGMVHDMTPGTEEQLKNEITSGYIGFDPTAKSLHIGNLATIMLLVHFQRAGHKPIALVGGATGMIGDPSFKAAERKLLDEETLRENQEGIKKQLEQFLDFDCGENSAEILNNYDWFKNFGFLEFLRDNGKHISVNYMLAKDSVKKRLETGISFTEFTYQLLQGYDFYHLYANHNVKIQMGGSDQWGNITTGTEYIRRKAQGDAFALTAPLVTKSDGTKFGKSEGGNVWLDAEMTSPYQFYQFWLNCSDEDSKKLIRVFTLKTKDEIEALEKEHEEAPHLRVLQNALAEDITRMVHGEDDLETAKKATNILFGKSSKSDLEALNERTLLQVFEAVPQKEISAPESMTVTDFLGDHIGDLIFKSKGEARRMIKEGGISINKEKITDGNADFDFNPLENKYFLIQKGKKNYYLVKIV